MSKKANIMLTCAKKAAVQWATDADGNVRPEVDVAMSHLLNVLYDSAGMTKAEDGVAAIFGQMLKAFEEKVERPAESMRATADTFNQNRTYELERLWREAERASSSKDVDNAALRAQLDAMSRNPHALGTLGENTVADLIGRFMPKANVTIVGQNGLSESDLHVVCSSKGHLFSVESKNKKRITAADVAKSEAYARDLHAKHGALYLGHLFVSLKTTAVPGKGDFKIDPTLVPPAIVVWVGVPQLAGHEIALRNAFRTMTDNIVRMGEATTGGLLAGDEALCAAAKLHERSGVERKEVEDLIVALRDATKSHQVSASSLASVLNVLKSRSFAYKATCRELGIEAIVEAPGEESKLLFEDAVGNTAGIQVELPTRASSSAPSTKTKTKTAWRAKYPRHRSNSTSDAEAEADESVSPGDTSMVERDPDGMPSLNALAVLVGPN
jgi:hypothetical protein